MTANVIHNIPADGVTWAHCTQCGWQGPMHASCARGVREARGDRDQHNDERHPILIHAPALITEMPAGMDTQLFYEAARHVLGHYGKPGGWIPGGFTEGLLSTWGKADHHNRATLETAFPGMAAALQIYQQLGGEETLLSILTELDGE